MTKKYEFLAIKYMVGADRDVEVGPALVSTSDRNKFYHQLGPGYMVLESYTTLKSYGSYSLDDDAVDGILVQFVLDFYDHKPESGIAAGKSGWLSPEGIFYVCEDWEHDSLAYNLVICLTKKHPVNATLRLEEAGWVRVGCRYVGMRMNATPTEAQITTLMEIYANTTEGERRTSLRGFLRVWRYTEMEAFDD